MNLAHGRTSHRGVWLSLFAAWMLLLGPLTSQVLRALDTAPAAMPMPMMGMAEHGGHHPGMEQMEQAPSVGEANSSHHAQSFDEFACGYCQLLAHSALLLWAPPRLPVAITAASAAFVYAVPFVGLPSWWRPHGRAPPAHH